MVGRHVVAGICRGFGSVDDDVAYECAIEEVFKAQSLIDVVGDARAKVGVTVADVYGGRVAA